MADETKEFNRETLEQRIDRLEKQLVDLKNRSRHNQIALVSAIDKIDATALPRGRKTARILTGLEEEPQEQPESPALGSP